MRNYTIGIRIIIFIFLFGIIQNAYTQSIDSLKQCLKNEQNDTLKIEINKKIMKQFLKLTYFDSVYIYAQKAFIIADKLNIETEKSILLNKMGNTMYWTGYYNEADSLLKISLKLAIDLKDSRLTAEAYNSIATNKLQLRDTTGAIMCLKKALKLCNNENQILKARIYANLGQIARTEKQLKQAMKYFNISETIWKELNMINYIARIQFDKSKIYFMQKKYRAAINLVHSSINNANKNSNKAVELWKYRRLSESYKAIGMYDSAYHYFVIHVNMYRDVYGANRTRKIKELEIKYETKLKEKENKNLKTKNLLQEQTIKNRNIITAISLSSVLLILFIMILLIIGRKKLKIANQILNKQKKEITKQANSLRETNVKLKKLQEFKKGITSMIVHDLKNPLSIILNYSKQNPSLDINKKIFNNAHRMLNLVLSIMDTFKYSDTKMKIDKKIYALSNILKTAISEIEYFANKKNIKIINNITHEYQIEFDKYIILRVLNNILANAIKHTPNNGMLELNIKSTENKIIKIEIKDSGKGIDETIINRIFEKYIQDTETKTHGTFGIGLSFCKIAIEAHDGEIGVYNNADKGTTFWFTLKNIKITKKITENITITNDKIYLNDKEKLYLKTYINILKTIDIYEISKFREILKNIDEDNENIKKWKKDVYNAIINHNKKYLAKLLK